MHSVNSFWLRVGREGQDVRDAATITRRTGTGRPDLCLGPCARSSSCEVTVVGGLRRSETIGVETNSAVLTMELLWALRLRR